jgi:hypothetical protein
MWLRRRFAAGAVQPWISEFADVIPGTSAGEALVSMFHDCSTPPGLLLGMGADLLLRGSRARDREVNGFSARQPETLVP